MEVIVLAGGKGTRIRGLFPNIPKPMIIISNKPFLEILLNKVTSNIKVDRIILSVGYKKDIIINHFGYNYKSIPIEYSIEDIPLGTGGAIKRACNKILESHAIILNGDSYFDLDYIHFEEMFQNKNIDVLMALKIVEGVNRYGKVVVSQNNRIKEFCEKKDKATESGLINAGVYIVKKELIMDIPSNRFSIEKDFFQGSTEKYNIYGFLDRGSFVDIGIPEGYYYALKLFGHGI